MEDVRRDFDQGDALRRARRIAKRLTQIDFDRRPVEHSLGKLREGAAHLTTRVYPARAKCPYLCHTGRASNAEKQPTGSGLEGCVENGPAAALLVGYVSFKYAPSSRLAGGPF